MNCVLGVDFGGSSSKATLLGGDGNVYATASREYPAYHPQNGWAEQDADDSYDALVWNIREILTETGIRPERIAALALDADDRPVRRAIYWTDSRATGQAARLKAGYGENR